MMMKKYFTLYTRYPPITHTPYANFDSLVYTVVHHFHVLYHTTLYHNVILFQSSQQFIYIHIVNAPRLFIFCAAATRSSYYIIQLEPQLLVVGRVWLWCVEHASFSSL